MVGTDAFRPRVAATGSDHVTPSVELATRTSLPLHVGRRTQPCHVAQIRPEESTSAAGMSGARWPAGALRIAAIATGGSSVEPPSRERTAPRYRSVSPTRARITSVPSGCTTGNAPRKNGANGIVVGCDHVRPPSVDHTSDIPRRVKSL